MLFDDDSPKKPATHELGCDLSMFSVDELRARISLLRGEIERLEAEIDRLKLAVIQQFEIVRGKAK